LNVFDLASWLTGILFIFWLIGLALDARQWNKWRRVAKWRVPR